MRQKICITTLEYPPDVGGVGESVQRISHFLTQAGYEVHVAVFRSKQRLVSDNSRRRASCDTTLQDGVFVHRIKSAVRMDSTEIQDFFGDVYFYLKLLHQQYHFDVFHAFFINETGYVTTLLAKEENIPVINSVRGSDLHKHIFNPKNHAPLTWVLERSNWVTFVSRDLKHRAEVLVPSIANKSSAFWNSIVPIDFSQVTDGLSKQQMPGIVIGSSGRLRDKKGMEFLLDACAQLQSKLELSLLLIGDFVEKERDYWEQEIQNCGLGDRLHITGIVSRQQALAYLPMLDIFVIPSMNDGCPNALLEAMMAGRAIIGSRVDAIGEILEHGVNGWLVNPGRADELAAAIQFLATHPELRQEMGFAAHRKVLEHLAPAVEFQNWLTVYQTVLGATPSLSLPELSIA